MPVTSRVASLALLLLLAAAAATASAGEGAAPPEEDPEVTACKQQCARQPQFGAAERRCCVERCEEYGRDKHRREEENEEGPERERDRCLDECRVGPPKPGCERWCQEAYEQATSGGVGIAAIRRIGGGPGWF